jgi:hypothetical protein
MKGKLVKRSNGRFDLYKIEDVDQLNTIASSFDNPKGKLSLKNCQAIELGYDLNELAKEECEYNQDSLRQYDSKFIEFYKEGFQKALEILGDKKFSEGDIIKAIKLARIKDTNPKNTSAFLTLDEEIIQSLQQTWDVEIEKEFIFDPAMGISQGYYSDKPKLDSNGNLILKRL